MPRRRRPLKPCRSATAAGCYARADSLAAGQKTARECREEWSAKKAANQANGVTEKAYVAQCRGGTAPAQTTTAPPQPPAPAPAPTVAPACSGSSTNGSRSFCQTGSPATCYRRTRRKRSGKSGRGERILNRSQAKARCSSPILSCGSI